MPDCCPTCGHAIASLPDPDADALTLMRAACVTMQIVRSWDDHVSERDAAKLLNRSPKTLRNRRALDRPLPFRRRGGRVEYALIDVCRGTEMADEIE
jgi:hypothetical protein